jgi:hypothetical protein
MGNPKKSDVMITLSEAYDSGKRFGTFTGFLFGFLAGALFILLVEG